MVFILTLNDNTAKGKQLRETQKLRNICGKTMINQQILWLWSYIIKLNHLCLIRNPMKVVTDDTNYKTAKPKNNYYLPKTSQVKFKTH